MGAKHQYSTWIRVRKYVILYILTEKVQVLSCHRAWFNITWILHHEGRKSKIYNTQKIARCSWAAGWESREQVKRRQDWKDLRLIRLFLEESLIFRSGVLLGPSSEAWTSKSRVVRKQPNEYVKRSQMACINKYTCTRKHVVYSNHANMK